MKIKPVILKFYRVFSYFFFLLIALFVCDRLLYFSIASTEVNFYYDKSYIKRLSLFLEAKNYHTLILGTSRTDEAIYPSCFKKYINQAVYKEATYGKAPKYNYKFYLTYKKLSGPPKILIYGIDYFIFNINSNKQWLARLEKPSYKKGVFSSISLLLTNKKRIDDFINNLLIKFQANLENKKESKPTFEFEKNQVLNINEKELKNPDTSKLVLKKPDNFKTLHYLKYPGAEGKYFKKLLKACHRDNVTVLLIIIPEFIGTYKTNIQHKRLIRDIKKIIGKLKNIHILNYNHPDRFPIKNPKYFRDGGFGKVNSHFSKLGAKLFNEILINDIKTFYNSDII